MPYFSLKIRNEPPIYYKILEGTKEKNSKTMNKDKCVGVICILLYIENKRRVVEEK